MTLPLKQSSLSLPDNVFNELPPAAQCFINHLLAVIQQQGLYIQQLETRIQQQEIMIQQQATKIQELEKRLSKDSSNSSKPPSSDGLKRKPKSEREKSGKKPGGQEGHPGKYLARVNNPDYVVNHTPEICNGCGCSLGTISGTCVETRQVFDIPQPKIKVTEHRVEVKCCPCCGNACRASFPENVKGPVQYGERAQALMVYFSHQHYIPVNRVCQIFEDVFGTSISPGTCANIDLRLFKQLESFEASLKTYLLAEQVLHFDETGIRCSKKLHWVHVTSSDTATLYFFHKKRGKEAMDEIGIIPQFQGKGVHDHWFPYFSYQQIQHSLCNAHHLRELTYMHEQEKEDWAKEMKNFLIRAKVTVEQAVENGVKAFSEDFLVELDQQYTKILLSAEEYHQNLAPLPQKKRAKPKQRDGKNLLDRLRGKRDCVLRFIRDFSVPFTNNLGERDIRMVKLKQKIAGCFREFDGGRLFCRIRSYISTARKQEWNIWNSLAEAIAGKTRLLSSH